MKLKVFLACCALFLTGNFLQAQQVPVYNPLETFYPMQYAQGDVYRTAAGRPGAKYWQNRADYQIASSFDTLSKIFSAKMTLSYSNNSPDVLNEVWLLLGQNRFRKDSRATALTPLQGSRFGIQEFTEGFILDKVMVQDPGSGKLSKASCQVMNDQLKVVPVQALAPLKKIILYIEYRFKLPVNGSDFLGMLPTLNGTIYQFSAWYPRALVYDNIKGWNTANSGYYVEPGTLDYTITVPSEMIVQGSGKLINPQDVLTRVQQQRLAAAAKSDHTVQIRRADELNQAPAKPAGSRSTWHFKADNAGDGIFAVSKAFIWDAVKVNVPGKNQVMAMSLYPIESNIPTWKESAHTLKKVIENYSRRWGAYPYSTAVNIAGSVTGIAGPAACFIHYKSDGTANGVWAKLNHEAGHFWFNMMVYTNGRYGWMVEGLNSFINHVNGEDLGGQAAFQMPEAVSRLARTHTGQAVSTPFELIHYKNFAMLSYMKPAIALNLLRTQVLGAERFDPAFKGFIASWKSRHPMPSDFFRYMENAAGEDLCWFWQSWFVNDWKLDQAITRVAYVNGKPEEGINITLYNKEKMVMPAVLEITDFNGNVGRLKLPAEIWQKGAEWTFHYPSKTAVSTVYLDPDKSLPDVDFSNNTWQEDPSGKQKEKI